MSKSYHVIWAHTAEEDLIHIIAYIQKDNPSNARQILDKIKTTVTRLKKFPKRGRIVPELQEQGILQYREIVISPWRVLYKITGNKVQILSVIDSRQNLEDILLNRLVRKKGS